ncbi:hypothetical protein C8F01DRAFT_1195325 [Mycena amicta]|nr:hypothetical protein C8F01DRAFT_1195325 [Mycena amicta]
MTHRARHGVGLYSVGFILNRTQIATIAKDSFTPEWLEYHINDPFIAFVRHSRQYHCELISTRDPERFFVAVHFYPWVIGQTPDPEVAGIPEERRKMWNEQYGQYAGKCTEVTHQFPLHRGGTSPSPSPSPLQLPTVDPVPMFLAEYVEGVIETHGLQELFQPIDASPAVSICSRCRSPLASSHCLSEPSASVV